MATSSSNSSPRPSSPRILSVGQCGADSRSIASLLSTHFAATVDTADTAAHARRRIDETAYDLVLVNRILDADGDSGLDLITALAAAAASPPVMLVSDRADAQSSATTAGAVPGFGKATLRQASTVTTLQRALARSGKSSTPA